MFLIGSATPVCKRGGLSGKTRPNGKLSYHTIKSVISFGVLRLEPRASNKQILVNRLRLDQERHSCRGADGDVGRNVAEIGCQMRLN